ncbi:MAG: glycosyltransferase [Erysipelotrichaceae bacterium]|nr:glycosyltransferase [Erysipelotrichaceae bacterium]
MKLADSTKEIIKNKKVSIIMPTYNDAKSIVESMDSLRKQTYSNWEFIIVDDGSVDNTKQVVEEYRKKYDLEDHIHYIYQDNADQLKAILRGSEIMQGDYVFILHSDDLLASDTMLGKAVEYMEKNKTLDAIISDLIIINEHGETTGRQQVLKYKKKKTIPVTQLLWLGRNLYVDVGFYRAESFIEQIKENYLVWNTPFWLVTTERVRMLNVENVDFEFIKYRVHSENYINDEMGKLNVLNGELRVVTRLMKFYEISGYSLQYKIFRVFAKLKLLHIYKPIYKVKETTNKADVLDFVIRKRFPEGYDKNIFLNSLVMFYKHQKKRAIEFTSLYTDESIYKGNEMRKFNKQLINDKLPSLYIKIMEEMKQGFDEIIVHNDKEYEKAKDLIQFLCIYPYVKITKK